MRRDFLKFIDKKQDKTIPCRVRQTAGAESGAPLRTDDSNKTKRKIAEASNKEYNVHLYMEITHIFIWIYFLLNSKWMSRTEVGKITLTGVGKIDFICSASLFITEKKLNVQC